MPKGVREDQVTTKLIKKILKWGKTKLKKGLKITYHWILKELSKKKNK